MAGPGSPGNGRGSNSSAGCTQKSAPQTNYKALCFWDLPQKDTKINVEFEASQGLPRKHTQTPSKPHQSHLVGWCWCVLSGFCGALRWFWYGFGVLWGVWDWVVGDPVGFNNAGFDKRMSLIACTWFGDIRDLKPYDFMGFRATIISHTPASRQEDSK